MTVNEDSNVEGNAHALAMACICVNDKCLALTCSWSSVIYKFESEDCVVLNPGEEIIAAKKPVEDSTEYFTPVVCSAFSDCGELFAYCTKKCLSLWRCKDWTLVSRRSVARTASRIRFTPKSRSIIVADKTGDVYLYSSVEPESPGTLILGHLSMLLDMLVTPDEAYILTSDRDEKIRVSCFPNSYNICCFCLGHEEFVTSMNFLKHDLSVLVSGSGDGTLRFWTYTTGKLLLKYDCASDLSADVRNSALTCTTTLPLDEHSTLLCVSVVDLKGILVYLVKSDPIVSCVKHTSITLSNVPWHIESYKNRLWLLLKNKTDFLVTYQWSETEGFKNCANDSMLNSIVQTDPKLNNYLEELFKNEHIVTQLYKRRFDNVKEYMERKMARLDSSGEPELKKSK